MRLQLFNSTFDIPCRDTFGSLDMHVNRVPALCTDRQAIAERMHPQGDDIIR